MKKISSLLKESKCPLMIYLNQKETASTDSIATNVFRDKDNGITLVTNLTAPKSIVGGTAPAKIEGITENIDVASLLADDTVSHMVDSEGNHLYVDVELAFDLNGEKFNSLLTGNEVTLKYAESADEADAVGEDDSVEDTSEDESDSEDVSEEDDSDDSAEDEIETVTSVEDVPAEEDSEGDGEDDSSEEEDDTTDMEDDSSDDSEEDEMATKPAVVTDAENADDESEDDSSEEETTDSNEEDKDAGSEEIEVSMLDMVDSTKAIRLVSVTNDGSEIAAFVGGLPVGSLRADRASEAASFLYSDSKKLFHTFKDRFLHAAKNGKYGELASLGFEPYVARTEVSALVSKFIEQETASVSEEIAAERSTGIERHKKVVNLAMVGILKGLYDKATNPLVKEVSSLLRQAGHQSPEMAARRALVGSAGEFAKAVFARADELAKADDAYLNGIADTVSSADFKSSENESTDLGKVTTLFGGHREAASEEGFVAEPTKSTGNRFDKVVAGLGRGRFGR